MLHKPRRAAAGCNPQRIVLGMGVLSTLTSVSMIAMSLTRSSGSEGELQELRAVSHTLQERLRTAQLDLVSEKARASKQQQLHDQQHSGLRHQEEQLQRELEMLHKQREDLAAPASQPPPRLASPPPPPPLPWLSQVQPGPLGEPDGATPPNGDDDAWPPVTPALSAARRAAGRHPTYRLAMVVPWLGDSFPPWFEYFLESCRRSDYLVDWLIFHQNAQAIAPPAPRRRRLPPPPTARRRVRSCGAQMPTATPANVVFVNLGSHGLGIQFGATLARATNQSHNTYALVKMFQLAFQNFAYIVTEYKPTLGVVFADYLRGYSHWSYTDIDLMVGDLPLFLDREELQDFDVVTYSFGDYERLYMRGQFTAHKNTRRVSTLWTACDFLGAGLLRELQTKQAQVARAKEAGQEGLRPRFNSAEGCYSRAVTSHPELRVKYATKVLADFTAETEIYLARGAARMCARRANHSTARPWDEDYASHPAAGGARRCDPFAAPAHAHAEELPGNQRAVGPLIPVATHANCSRWVEEKYRLCADCSEGWGDDWNLFYLHGAWYRQHFVNEHAPGLHEGAFFHFQVWKGAYKRLRYGEHGMERVRAGAGFKLMAHGIFPLEPDAPA